MINAEFPFLFDAAAGAAAAVAPDPVAAAAPAVAPAAPEAAAPAPAAAPGSLLARGAKVEEQAPAAGEGDKAAPEVGIPEKYIVRGSDGAVDEKASLAKLLEGHKHLEKRLGAGDAPPAKPEDYSLDGLQGVNVDTLKADPKFTGFLKGAHSRGINNAQLQWVIGEYAQRMQPDPEAAEAELRQVWPQDAAFNTALKHAHRFVAAFAGDNFERLNSKFGTDPDFLRLAAAVGAQMGEDKAPPADLSQAEEESMEMLMSSPAYLDGRHPEHARTVAKVRALFSRKYPGQ